MTTNDCKRLDAADRALDERNIDELCAHASWLGRWTVRGVLVGDREKIEEAQRMAERVKLLYRRIDPAEWPRLAALERGPLSPLFAIV